MKRIRMWYSRDPLQTKYLILVLISMLLPVLVMYVSTSYLLKWLTRAMISLPQEAFLEISTSYEKLKYFWASGTIGAFLIVLLWGLYFSHRLIGPMRRLERDLDEVINGNMTKDIKVRPEDDLKGVADRIQQLVVRLRSR